MHFSTELCTMQMKKGILFFGLLLMLGNSYAQCILTFPAIEDFENNNGSWVPGGTNADWSWGAPVKSAISSAGSGQKCWISGGLAGAAYAGSQKSFVESPCYNLSSLQKPYLSFLIYWDTERQYDGGNLQYSINNGLSWLNLGTTGQPVDCIQKNWFNTPSITNLSGLASPTQGWSGTLQPTSGNCTGGGGSGDWVEAGICIGFLAGQPNVKFRFTFSSGSTCNAYDGIAFDRFTIAEAPIPQPIATFSCQGGNKVEFTGSSTLCPQQWNWNFGDNSTSADVANTQNAQYTYPAGGSYTVTLTTSHICSANGTTTITVNFPELTVLTSPVTCKDSKDGTASATVTAATSPVFSWGTSPQTLGPDVNNLDVGTYQLNIQSADACSIDTIITIEYGPDAFPKVDLGPNRIICFGDIVTLSAGEFDQYLWQDGSSDSVYVAADAGIYSVIVSNTAGCTAEDEVEVLNSCGDNLFIPNAFTPGTDGLNDRFGVITNLTFQEGWLIVLNRMGQVIYKDDVTAIGWDGTYGGEQAPEGVYFYRCRYRLIGDKFREKTGLVTLLR